MKPQLRLVTSRQPIDPPQVERRRAPDYGDIERVVFWIEAALVGALLWVVFLGWLFF